MITGTVNARLEGILRLRIVGPTGRDVLVDAIIDTGFTGALVLPAAVINQLGLVRHSGGSAVLADGSTRPFDLYAADVDWIAGPQPLLVSAVGSEALVGMRLLAGNELLVQVRHGGRVEITPMAP